MEWSGVEWCDVGQMCGRGEDDRIEVGMVLMRWDKGMLLL